MFDIYAMLCIKSKNAYVWKFFDRNLYASHSLIHPFILKLIFKVYTVGSVEKFLNSCFIGI
jgi:hypothetical protein